MIPDDFFTPRSTASGTPRMRFDRRMVGALFSAPLDGRDDIEVGAALSQLLHQELLAYGTGGTPNLDDDDMQVGVRALRAALDRVGVEFHPLFRDFTTFEAYWKSNGAAGRGGYEARRNILDTVFQPVHKALEDLQLGRGSLAEPVSPTVTGWEKVDIEITELRRRFRSAETPQDYRAVGTHCVGVIEALSRTVYDSEIHLRDGEVEPPVDKSKIRIDRFIEDSLPGPAHEEIRSLAKKAVAVAHQVKHREAPTRRDAGIAADTVILLANILRHLDEDEWHHPSAHRYPSST